MRYFTIITLVLLSYTYADNVPEYLPCSYMNDTLKELTNKLQNFKLDIEPITSAIKSSKLDIKPLITAIESSKLDIKPITDFIDSSKLDIKQLTTAIENNKINVTSITEAITKIRLDVTPIIDAIKKIKFDDIVNAIHDIDTSIFDDSIIKQFEQLMASKSNTSIVTKTLELFEKISIDDAKIFFTIISIAALIHSASMIFFVILVVYFVFIKTIKKKNKISMNVGYSSRQNRREI